MKRGVSLVFVLLFSISFASAACDLDATLLNQDPYPAVPGDYVKIVFQITGVENTECGDVTFNLIEKYPISLDPNTSSDIRIDSGTFLRDHSSFLLAPYKVRIDPDTLDGDNSIEAEYTHSKSGSGSTILKEFTINVQDTKADFELFVKDYDFSTNTLEIEILNIGDQDIEALTMEIPQQEGITVKGPNRNILGDLDSQEYTSADFEATLDKGNVSLNIYYTDTIGERRSLEKSVLFDPIYFEDRKADEKPTPWSTYIIVLLIVAGIIWWQVRKRKKKHAHRHAHKH